MAGTDASPRPLRVDAARNRARILQAAGEVFAERGLDVTLDDIAAHAGLGVGTVYRRFPDREALVEAFFADHMQAKAARMREALAVPPEQAWDAFLELFQEFGEHIAKDRGMRQVMLSSAYGHTAIAACKDEMRVISEELVERAKATGRLRPDFEATDMPVIMLMIGSIADFASPVAPDLWRRYFEMMVDGVRTQPTGRDLAPAKLSPCGALDYEDLLTAMQGWRPPALR